MIMLRINKCLLMYYYAIDFCASMYAFRVFL